MNGSPRRYVVLDRRDGRITAWDPKYDRRAKVTARLRMMTRKQATDLAMRHYSSLIVCEVVT
jgi:hypothetical protein